MNFLNYYFDAFKKVFNFEGIASRKEYWSFFLVHIIIFFALALMAHKIVFMVYFLIVLIPQISLGTRRLHDAGMSGWVQLVAIIPYIGTLILLMLLMYSSKTKDNKYLKSNS